MKDVMKIIKCWETYRSIPELLALNITVSDVKTARVNIKALDAPIRRNAFKCLREIMLELTNITRAMQNEKNQIHEHFKKADLSKKACLAYHKQGRTKKTK